MANSVYSNAVNSPISATVTIATSASSSDAVNLGGRTIVGIIWPAAFQGTTVRPQLSYDKGVTYYPVAIDDEGPQHFTKVLGSVSKPSNPAAYAGVDYIKLVAYNDDALSVQSADRVFKIIAI